MLLILNLPLIPLWVRILKVPYYILFPMILIFCVIGSYSLSNSIPDVIIMVVFGVVGYLMRKFEYEGAPLIMALVLGQIFENSFRQSLIISKGSLAIFVNRPLSAVMLTVALVLIISPLFFGRPAVQEDED